MRLGTAGLYRVLGDICLLEVTISDHLEDSVQPENLLLAHSCLSSTQHTQRYVTTPKLDVTWSELG